MTSFAFLFPGQGSQSVGMLDAWGDHPAVRETLQEASDALGQDLAHLIHEGPKEALGLTTNTQPVMLVAGVAAWRVWCAEGGAAPAVVAAPAAPEPDPEPVVTIPGKPLLFSLTSTDTLHATLSWSEGETGGSPITGYDLTYAVSGDLVPETFLATLANVLTLDYDHPHNATPLYVVGIRAANRIGTSTEMATTTVAIPPPPPPAEPPTL